MKKSADEEVRAELQFHLEMRAAQNQREGMSPAEAQAAAQRQFGNVTQIREEVRSLHINQFLETVAQDARYALRGFLRAPAFTLAALLTLALGIGATTAVFSVVDRILFRSLPYPNEDRLVWLGMAAPIDPNEFVLGADYLDWRDAPTPFQALTSTSGTTDCDITEGEPVQSTCGRVEWTFLPTLGVQPYLGRNFTREEDRPGVPGVALLSYGLWRSRFGGDRAVTGRTVAIDGRAARIVGVLPPRFELPSLARVDFLVPQALDENQLRKRQAMVLLTVFGRLKPGVTLAQGEAALGPLFERSLQFVPPQFRKEVKLRVYALRDRQVREARTASWMLLGAVVGVLLISCANVANLLVARAASRQRERTIRAALGAGRARLIRQTLTESLLLGLAGGLAGVGLAGLLLRVFVAIAPEGIPRLGEAMLDRRILLFACGASILCGILFGLAPALREAHPDGLAGRSVIGSSSHYLRQWLVAVQLAVAVVLLTGAGLLLQSLWRLQNVQLGVRAENVLSASVTLNRQRFPEAAQQATFFDALEARLKTLPAVTAVAVSDSLPPAGRPEMIYSRIGVEGRSLPQGEGTGGMVLFRVVTPGYFAALGIPLVRGRGFTEEDRGTADSVIILGEALARRMFPGEDPSGKRLRPGMAGPWRTVIGVARDVKNNGLAGRDDPEYYELLAHGRGLRRASVTIRSQADPDLLAGLVRAEIRALDATTPVTIESLNQRVGRLVQRPRFNTLLLSLFAAMGMLLAAIGLYGVMAFLVAQRTPEIGLRMALGATGGEIRRLVLSHAARSLGIGAALGVGGSFFAARYLESLLFGVKPHDPATLGSGVALLLAVGLAAAWLPARRAVRLDPAAVLRHE